MKNLLVIITTFLIAGAGIFALTASDAYAGDKPSKAAPQETTLATSDQPGVPKGWITDFEAALKQAKAENKAVFIDFTGSDWCGWCIRLDEEILSKPAFEEYAKENLVRVYLDFPRGKPQSEALKQQNKALAEAFGVRGFPTVYVLDSDGEPIGRMGYQKGGPKPFIAELKKMTGEADKGKDAEQS